MDVVRAEFPHPFEYPTGPWQAEGDFGVEWYGERCVCGGLDDLNHMPPFPEQAGRGIERPYYPADLRMPSICSDQDARHGEIVEPEAPTFKLRMSQCPIQTNG